MRFRRSTGLVFLVVVGVAATFGVLTAVNPVAETPDTGQPTRAAPSAPSTPDTDKNRGTGTTRVGATGVQSRQTTAGGVYGGQQDRQTSTPNPIGSWDALSEPQRDSGIQFREVADSRSLSYEAATTYDSQQEFVSNSGAYVADYDRDGWPDLLLVGGDRPVLFHNRNGSFERTDRLAGLNRTIQSAVFFDYDRDGWPDLFLLANYDRPVVFENENGRFTRRDVGLPELSMPYAATAGDYDGDGCPDLFLAQYGDWRDGSPGGYLDYNVTLDSDTAYQNRLFDGDCTSFSDATSGSGVTGSGWTLATSSVDFDGDGDLDVYVSNDYNQDVFYRNAGDGTFRRERQGEVTNRNGMAAEVTDVNGDGSPDVFVTNIFFTDAVADEFPDDNDHLHGNSLMVNDGDGTFRERAAEYGVRRGGQGWATAITDLDNDGDADLVHATRQFSRYFVGDELRNAASVFRFYRYPVVRERVDDGFEAVRADDAGFEQTDGRGLAHFDFDRDGDADLLVADADGRFRLYENVGADGGAVQVTLRADDRPTLGATVTLATDGTEQTKFRTTETDLLSQDTRTLHFGVGDADSATVTVAWPDGATTHYTDLAAGHRYVLGPDGVERRLPFVAGDDDA